MARRSQTERVRRRAERARERAATADVRRERRRLVAKVLFCVAAACVFGALPVFVNDVIGYLPIVAYLILLAMCGGYVAICRHFLSFEGVDAVGTVTRGNTAHFTITLRNRGALPMVHVAPVLVVGNDAGGTEKRERFAVSLSPFETFDVDFDTCFAHIGNYHVGIPTVEVRDMLGLFTTKIETGAMRTVEVQPRVFDVTELAFDHELLKETPEARTPMALEGSDYTGVRDYANGDPMKSIHWKLSARGTTYYTKLFETLGKPGIEVVMDFHSPAYDEDDLLSVFDSVVEGGLSIGAYARKYGMDFTMAFRGRSGRDERVSGMGTGHSKAKFMQSVPDMTTDPRDISALELYRRETLTRLGQPNMALVTASFDESTIAALLDARRHRRNPSLIAVVPPGLTENEVAERTRPLKRLDSAKVSYLVVSAAEEMSGSAA